MFDSSAELAERQTEVNEIAKLLNTKPVISTNSVALTNEPPVPSDKLAKYKSISGLLDALEKKSQELQLQFTPENSLVKSGREQIAENTKLKKQLEEENPGLL